MEDFIVLNDETIALIEALDLQLVGISTTENVNFAHLEL